MRPVIRSFKMLLVQLSKDGMLILIMIVPLLAGSFFHFGIPLIDKLLAANFNQGRILHDYYALFDLLLATLTPYMFCFVAAMTMLDEFDANIIRHLCVTPIRKQGYLLSRLVLPALMAFLTSIAVLLLFSLTVWQFWLAVATCFLTCLMSLSMALLVFAYSKNKVEGMAIAKLSGLIMLGLPIPFFMRNGSQYFFSLLPSFWIAKFQIEPGPFIFLTALTAIAIWGSVLYRKFNKKLSS